MNFVAHQFLSFQNPEIQIGNLLGEIVRGKDYQKYKGDVQKGILLHRKIDSFTDDHPAVKNSSRKFHERYGKYSPVIVDVLYDYILIGNWEDFSDQPYEHFVNDCYQLFELHFEEFPPRLQFIVKHLLKHDWFRNYTTLEGIQQTLAGISQRSKFKNNIRTAVEEMVLYKAELEADFHRFFPELIQHCKTFINS